MPCSSFFRTGADWFNMLGKYQTVFSLVVIFHYIERIDGSKFNQGCLLIEKPPPNRVRIQSRMSLDSKTTSEQGRIQSRMALDSKITSEQGQNSIKEGS